jgi:hypothetical protein
MVELLTTSAVPYYTDSNGLIAFYEPGLMDHKVFFSISGHGYEYHADGFGIRGIALQTTPGTTATLKIKRLNIAERLYRVTGQGIYRDTVLRGRKPPIDQPLLNGQVTGQDGILTALYRGRLYWLYGDTNKLSYALGNFQMTGATSDPPEKIDPSVGVSLHYFTNKEGTIRPMVPMKGEGVVWLSGLVVLPDESGNSACSPGSSVAAAWGPCWRTALSSTTSTTTHSTSSGLTPSIRPSTRSATPSA